MLEVITHENIQHRVEEAVRCHQAGAYFESNRYDSVVVFVDVQLKHDEDVIGQPADEKSGDERSHDFEGFGGFGHPVGFKFEDDGRVADDDDGERDDKPSKEAAHCDYLVTVV